MASGERAGTAAPEGGQRARHLMIVSPSRPELYERLVQLFWGLATVEVIFDRRRRGPRSPDRSPDRRRPSTVDAELAAQGCAIVSHRPGGDTSGPR